MILNFRKLASRYEFLVHISSFTPRYVVITLDNLRSTLYICTGIFDFLSIIINFTGECICEIFASRFINDANTMLIITMRPFGQMRSNLNRDLDVKKFMLRNSCHLCRCNPDLNHVTVFTLWNICNINSKTIFVGSAITITTR